ncbi:MAG TPA: DUF5667 domain-containing protein [Patescibacteria group bacterium]|nr:DUF5667 domain-containing protein [Patescibacteria group bacterium]
MAKGKAILLGLVLLLVVLFGGVFTAKAEELVSTTVIATANASTTVSPTNTTVLASSTASTTVKVPGAWGLWWSSLKEKVSLLFTTDPVSKGEKQIAFAEERLRVAELMAASDDPRAKEKAQKMIERANELIQKFAEKREKWEEKQDQRVEKLKEKAANHLLRREEVIKKIEVKLGPEKLKVMEELRLQGLEKGERLLNAINNEKISPEVKSRLEAIKVRIEEQAKEMRGRVELRGEVKTEVRNNEENRGERRNDRKEEIEAEVEVEVEASL